jgi:hypothetical protein
MQVKTNKVVLEPKTPMRVRSQIEYAILAIFCIGLILNWNIYQSVQAHDHWAPLTLAQMQIFRNVLHNKPPGQVDIYWLAGSNKPDRKDFAEQLAQLLQAEHWTAQAWGRDDPGFPGGITVHMQNKNAAPPYTLTLRSALAVVERPSRAVSDPDAFSTPDQLQLIIGYKSRR